MPNYHLDHLQHLETEAIHVLREVAGEFDRPALLFSGGKDSICLPCRCSMWIPGTIFPR
jgi:sulfate adenylyltransferase subunit 2